jgi:DNA-binding transcriptional MerR regulator
VLTIGSFSRATHLSVRTLRRYHELRLLVPATVDPTTGYRSYAREQILDAQLIHRLRNLDLPLAVVGQLVESRDPGLTTKVLGEHRETLRQRRLDLDQMIAGVGELLAGPRSLDLGLVHVRDQRADPAVLVRGRTTERDFETWFARAFRTLAVHVSRSGLVVSGAGGGRFPDRQWDPDDVEVEALLPVDRAVPGPGVEAGRLPAGRLAVVLHAGPYDGVVAAHGLLGEWAATQGVEPDGSLQEIYLVGPHHTPTTAAWRTEVGWLLHSAPDREETSS